MAIIALSGMTFSLSAGCFGVASISSSLLIMSLAVKSYSLLLVVALVLANLDVLAVLVLLDFRCFWPPSARTYISLILITLYFFIYVS